MQTKQRIVAIDVMRGLTLFLMLFVNDLYVDGVPVWLTHRPADYDGMGLADWVFPGFLFMVGMAVPFAIQNRLKKGDSVLQLFYHILIRSISLLIIGVLMLNVNRINPELSGINKYIWAILVYVCIFLIWNLYSGLTKKKERILKITGLLGLIVLLVIFKSGLPGNVTWIKTGWWGILGLIGWGYLVTSLVYLFVRDKILITGIVWAIFIALNILTQLELIVAGNLVNSAFGVIISGSTPSLVMAGLFFSLVLRKQHSNHKRFIISGLVLAGIYFAFALLLNKWFIISKIKGTPSWGMLCTAISTGLFLLLYIIIDVWHKKRWCKLFEITGKNSLTTYLAPNVIYYSIWFSGIPLLVYKQSGIAIVIVLGSILWSIIMVYFVQLLSRVGVQLKL